MQQSPVVHSTFVIERRYPIALERVFAAFADPAQKRRWFVDAAGNQVEHYEMDFRVGGKESARFRFKKPGALQDVECVNDGRYQDVVPDRRLVLAYSMTIDGKCISASLVTFEFSPIESGTDLVLTHQGAFFEGADGPEMREAGWRALLERLGLELSR